MSVLTYKILLLKVQYFIKKTLSQNPWFGHPWNNEYHMYRPDDSFMNPVSIIILTSFLLNLLFAWLFRTNARIQFYSPHRPWIKLHGDGFSLCVELAPRWLQCYSKLYTKVCSGFQLLLLFYLRLFISKVLYCFYLYRLLNNPLTAGCGLLLMFLAMVVSLLNSPTQEHLLFGLSVMVMTVHQLQFGHSTTEPI